MSTSLRWSLLRGRGSPVQPVQADRGTPIEAPRASNRENLEQSLPFLVGGALCIGLAGWFALSHSHLAGSHPSLLLLLAGVGITLGGGGIALSLVEEPSEDRGPIIDPEHVLVDRAEWDRLQVAERLSPLRNPELVARMSEGVIRDSRPSAAASTPPSAAPARSVSGAAAPPPPRSSPTAPNSQLATPWLATPPATPIWQEEPIQELETVLAELERDGADLQTRARPRPDTTPPEVCGGCGGAVTSYSEQACVVCGKPLCESCLDQSVTDQRPSICPSCAAPSSR